MNVVMPTRLPCASNKPPPEEPFEIGADVWKCRPSASARFDEMMPSARLNSSPRCADGIYALSDFDVSIGAHLDPVTKLGAGPKNAAIGVVIRRDHGCRKTIAFAFKCDGRSKLNDMAIGQQVAFAYCHSRAESRSSSHDIHRTADLLEHFLRTQFWPVREHQFDRVRPARAVYYRVCSTIGGRAEGEEGGRAEGVVLTAQPSAGEEPGSRILSQAAHSRAATTRSLFASQVRRRRP